MRPQKRVVRAPRFAVVGVAVPGWYPLELCSPQRALAPSWRGDLTGPAMTSVDPRPPSVPLQGLLSDMAACERAGGGATGDPAVVRRGKVPRGGTGRNLCGWYLRSPEDYENITAGLFASLSGRLFEVLNVRDSLGRWHRLPQCLSYPTTMRNTCGSRHLLIT